MLWLLILLNQVVADPQNGMAEAAPATGGVSARY
jgi:hypothetical protein